MVPLSDMNSLMLTKEFYMEHLPECQPGESLEFTIAKDGETVATLRGTVSKAGKDGSYNISLEAAEAEADDDGPVEVKKSAKAKAAMDKPKKKSMSAGAKAAMGY